MSAILVTGSAGFLGSHLVEYLADLDYHVVGIDNLFRGKYIPRKCKFYKIDLVTEFDKLLGLVKSVKPEIVIHYAAINGTRYFYEIPHKVLDLNVRMTQNILSAIASVGSVDKIVYASSSEVYGEPLQIPTPESHPILLDVQADRDSYAVSKAVGEFYVRLFSKEYGVKYLILRIFNTYGPRMDTSEYGQVIPEFIRKVFFDSEFTLYGDGKQTRAFMYIEDHVRLVTKLIQKVPNVIVNVGNDKEIAILELARLIHEIVGRPFRPKFLPPRPNDRKRRCPDITLLKALTNDYPRIDLVEGLVRTINWYANLWGIKIDINEERIQELRMRIQGKGS